jgi:3-phenylpropionate/trans-cinnamate dioxygenase ferredoxin component
LYAFDNLCTQQACPPSAGLLTGTTILYQYHGSQVDITTGAITNGPAAKDLSVSEVNDADGTINVRI